VEHRVYGEGSEYLTRLPPALSWEERAPFQDGARNDVRRVASKQETPNQDEWRSEA